MSDTGKQFLEAIEAILGKQETRAAAREMMGKARELYDRTPAPIKAIVQDAMLEIAAIRATGEPIDPAVIGQTATKTVMRHAVAHGLGWAFDRYPIDPEKKP